LSALLGVIDGGSDLLLRRLIGCRTEAVNGISDILGGSCKTLLRLRVAASQQLRKGYHQLLDARSNVIDGVGDFHLQIHIRRTGSHLLGDQNQLVGSLGNVHAARLDVLEGSRHG